eukprot:Skav221280  [mRNA]  locus=scaffold2775:160201:166465:+ [translate_table: standard]
MGPPRTPMALDEAPRGASYESSGCKHGIVSDLLETSVRISFDVALGVAAATGSSRAKREQCGRPVVRLSSGRVTTCRMPHGALSTCWLDATWGAPTKGISAPGAASDWWHVKFPKRLARRLQTSFLETSFDDALDVDSAVLPLDKMVAIRDACKLTLADANDSAGPSKIFHDNLEAGTSCAEKVGSNLLAASLGEGTGRRTRFKGNMAVELGSQDREDLQAMQDRRGQR